MRIQSFWNPHLLLCLVLATVSHVKHSHDSKYSKWNNGTDNACGMYRIRIQLPLKTKIPGRTTDDSPYVRSTFRIIAGIVRGAWLIIVRGAWLIIVRGAWLISRALGAARTEGGHPQGAGASDDGCNIDFSWQLLRIPWSNPVNKVEEACSRSNLRPIRIIVASSYVWLASHFTSSVSTWASSDGRNITCCDVVECPVWDGSSLRDVNRVPEQIRCHQRGKGRTHSPI